MLLSSIFLSSIRNSLHQRLPLLILLQPVADCLGLTVLAGLLKQLDRFARRSNGVLEAACGGIGGR